MKQIRLITLNSASDCFHCESRLAKAGIPFELILQEPSGHIALHIKDEFLSAAVSTLREAGFAAAPMTPN